ncbi:MAG: hypothetical protein SFU83_03415 [Meiothermus sp.]|nr:hypothetical protein [Meiothermus sp.]
MRKSKFVKSVLLAAGVLALAACGGAGVRENAEEGDLSIASGTVQVSWGNTVTLPTVPTWGQWFFFNDGIATGTGSFVNGPATPPIGTGSVQLVVDNTGRALIGTTQYIGTKLADIKALQYSTYNQTATTTIAPSLQFGYDQDITDSVTGFQGRLVYEPVYSGSVTSGVWQTWDTLAGKWWATNNATSTLDNACPQSNPCTLAQVLAAAPRVAIHPNSNFGWLLIKLGGPISGGFTANADRLVIRRVWETSNTIFNFESRNCQSDRC